MAVVIRDLLPQPAPERLHGHQIRAVTRQRHQPDVQGTRGLPDGLGLVIRCTIPEHNQRAIRGLSAEPAQRIDRVFAGYDPAPPPRKPTRATPLRQRYWV